MLAIEFQRNTTGHMAPEAPDRARRETREHGGWLRSSLEPSTRNAFPVSKPRQHAQISPVLGALVSGRTERIRVRNRRARRMEIVSKGRNFQRKTIGFPAEALPPPRLAVSLLVAKHGHRVYKGGSPSRDDAGNQRDREQQDGRSHQRPWISSGYPV